MTAIMKHLPVYQHRSDILDALEHNQVVVVESPTGSGKTTQIPIILDEAGYTSDKIVGITQPRRIAALSVSDFIKRQLEDEGSYVGYKMRFSDTTDKDTRIKVMTDGILLMEFKADPMLTKYAVMMVDEAHERSLNIDFVLGLLKNVLAARPEFKVIISSATINTEVFSQYFDNAPIVHIDARVHPVNIVYQPLRNQNQHEELFEKIVHIIDTHVRTGEGDVLVFLPGEFDIKTCVQYLNTSTYRSKLVINPLFGRLSKDEQSKVFIPTPAGKTKVVVATNIAETSVTIDGITIVIDSGVAKINYYNQKDFTSSLVSLPVSQSSCEQRAGRAGRTAPGVCFRLFDKNDYAIRPLYGTEEILRTDLSEVVLRMSELGIFDYEHFPFITKPKNSAIQSAEQTLRFINAIDAKRRLTSIGTLMVKFPLLPRHSRVIVEAMLRYPNVLDEVIIAISFLSSKTPFVLPPGQEDEARKAHQSFASEHGDFISFLDIHGQFKKQKTNEDRERFCKRYYLDYPSMVEILHVSEQIAEIVSEIGFPISSGGSVRDYLSCLAAGLLQFVCIKSKKNMYKSLTANLIYLHPGSAWFRELPQFIIAGEIVQTSRMYARTVSPLRREWLDGISEGLRKRLTALKDAEGHERSDRYERQSERRSRSVEVQQKSNKSSDRNVITIYRHEYVLESPKKGKREIAIIPLGELEYLSKMHATSGKRPKNFPAALLFNGQYIHYGDKFFTILELVGKLQPAKGILDSPPTGMYYASDPKVLTDNLEWILAFCRLKKSKQQIGFIALDAVGSGGYRFTVVKSFFEALDLSLYSVGELVDSIVAKTYPNEMRIAKKAYEYLLKIFDR